MDKLIIGFLSFITGLLLGTLITAVLIIEHFGLLAAV